MVDIKLWLNRDFSFALIYLFFFLLYKGKSLKGAFFLLWKSTENKKTGSFTIRDSNQGRIWCGVHWHSCLPRAELLPNWGSQEHKITLCLKLTTLSTTSGRAVLQKYRLMERIDRAKESGMERWLFVWSVFGAQTNGECRGSDENKNSQTLVSTITLLRRMGNVQNCRILLFHKIFLIFAQHFAAWQTVLGKTKQC